MNCHTADQISPEDYRKKKWGVLFDYFDVNRDNLLDTDEFMTFPRRLISTGKVHDGELLRRLYTEGWEKLCGINGLPRNNASLTKANFVTGCMALLETKWFVETFVPTIARIYFETLDRDNDGSISLEEWRVYNSNRGLTDDAVIRSTFNRLDRDGDGVITPEEMYHAVVQFNLGRDPNDDYSFLYSIN